VAAQEGQRDSRRFPQAVSSTASGSSAAALVEASRCTLSEPSEPTGCTHAGTFRPLADRR
jgi:hypothetical protein